MDWRAERRISQISNAGGRRFGIRGANPGERSFLRRERNRCGSHAQRNPKRPARQDYAQEACELVAEAPHSYFHTQEIDRACRSNIVGICWINPAPIDTNAPWLVPTGRCDFSELRDGQAFDVGVASLRSSIQVQRPVQLFHVYGFDLATFTRLSN